MIEPIGYGGAERIDRLGDDLAEAASVFLNEGTRTYIEEEALADALLAWTARHHPPIEYRAEDFG